MLSTLDELYTIWGGSGGYGAVAVTEKSLFSRDNSLIDLKRNVLEDDSVSESPKDKIMLVQKGKIGGKLITENITERRATQ